MAAECRNSVPERFSEIFRSDVTPPAILHTALPNPCLTADPHCRLISLRSASAHWDFNDAYYSLSLALSHSRIFQRVRPNAKPAHSLI